LGIILQANYRRSANPTVSVPAPNDGHGDLWWYDHLSTHMHEYAGAGVTHLQLNPVHMTIGGASPDSDGYGVWWEYHLGTKQNPTRFGDEQLLRRTCAIAHRNGILPMADWVPHQRYGGNNGKYLYDSWGGKGQGRFPKYPSYFRGDKKYGRVPNDPVADPPDDTSFGDELEPENSTPHGVVMNGLIDAGDWLFRSLDLAGCRNDDTKGQAVAAVNRWSNSKAMAGKPIIGEYAQGDKNALAWWIDQTNGRCYAFDFETKYHVRDMCNNGSRWDMQQLQWTGLISKNQYYSFRGVNFIENADSDTNGFGAVVFNKLLGYAFILMATGWPCVYYRDYGQEKYCYGLRPKIDNLIWIHEHLANGDMWWRHAEYQFAVFERQGWPGLLVGLNNDVWGGWKEAWVPTSFGPNAHLHDYSGQAGDLWTNSQGWVKLPIPPNDNGAGFVAYSRAGADQPNRPWSSSTTQLIEGAADLLNGPASKDGTPLNWEAIWCDAKTPLKLYKESGEGVRFEVLDPTLQNVVIPRGEWEGETTQRGWHYITAFSTNEGQVPYKVNATYTATPNLEASEVA
jgi:alpha-amylase